jgi:hypothetical protein
MCPSQHSIHHPDHAEDALSSGLADLRFKCPDEARTIDTERRERIIRRVRTAPPGSVPATEIDSEHERSWDGDDFDDETITPNGSEAPAGQQDDRERTILGPVITDSR